jgi:hypothetical protein
VQGNNDKGRTWFLSCYEIGWRDGLPFVIWDSPKFPMRKLTDAPGAGGHGDAFSANDEVGDSAK